MTSAVPTLHNSSNKSTTKSTTVVGGAVGGALGGIIVILLLAGLLLWRRKKNQETQKQMTVMKNQDISPTETEEGKAPQQFSSTPWTIPALRDEQPIHTNPATTTTTDVNLNQNTSVHTTNNSHANVPSRSDSAVPPLTYSSSPVTPSPTFISNPPEYGPSSPRSVTSSRSLSQALQLQGMSGAPFYDDEVGRWAAGNRDSISPELEQKLRDAHYRPSDDPREITDNIWSDRYGVGHYELKRIQELYQR